MYKANRRSVTNRIHIRLVRKSEHINLWPGRCVLSFCPVATELPHNKISGKRTQYPCKNQEHLSVYRCSLMFVLLSVGIMHEPCLHACATFHAMLMKEHDYLILSYQ